MAYSYNKFVMDTSPVRTLHTIAEQPETVTVLSIDACNLEYVDWTSSGNTEELYMVFYNSAAPTVGTDDPVLQFPVLRAASNQAVFAGLIKNLFTAGCSVAVKLEKGTAGASAPTDLVGIRVITQETS